MQFAFLAHCRRHPLISFSVTFGLLAGGVVLSLLRTLGKTLPAPARQGAD